MRNPRSWMPLRAAPVAHLVHDVSDFTQELPYRHGISCIRVKLVACDKPGLRGRNDQLAETIFLPGPSLGLDDRHLRALREKV
jgi:hypothetical protein